MSSMLPGGMDPKKMQALMKQMGIKSENIASSRVVIETDAGNIIIEKPEVVQITMQGQKSFQISGAVKMEEKNNDLKLIMEQTNCTESEAREALEKSGGDIAAAIISLSEGK